MWLGGSGFVSVLGLHAIAFVSFFPRKKKKLTWATGMRPLDIAKVIQKCFVN